MRAALVMLLAAGCGGSSTPDGLRAGTADAAFVRCLAAEPAGDRRFGVGSIQIDRRGRVLRIDGLGGAPRLAVIAGPAPATGRLDAALRALAEARPDLIVVLGSLGDDAASARRTAADLAAGPAPVLFVAGGRDQPATVASALAALPGPRRDRVLDASTLRRVELGDDVIVPLAGAPGGRYARSRDACGFEEGDVDRVAREARAGERPAERRWLLSWGAPTGQPGLAGAESGSPLVARAAEALGARATFAAWPETAAGLGLREHVLVVPPLAGLVLQRPDGTRIPPRATVVTLGEHGPLLE